MWTTSRIASGVFLFLALGMVATTVALLAREFLRRRLVGLLRETRAALLDAERRALLDGNAPNPAYREAVQSALAELMELEREAQRSFSSFEGVRDRCCAAGRLRAYLLPVSEVYIEGLAALAQLRGWGVNDLQLRELEHHLRSAADPGGDVRMGRAALAEVLALRDQWAYFVSRYFAQMAVTVAALLVVTLSCLSYAVSLLRGGHAVGGFLFAGASGTAVSIMLKLPPLSVQGPRSWFWVRSGARFAAGVMASAVGCGLVASGLINIALQLGSEPVSLSAMVKRCSEPAAVRVAAGEPAPGPGQPQPAPGDGGCTPGGVALLLGLGMLFGFSERALASFEGVVFALSGQATGGRLRERRPGGPGERDDGRADPPRRRPAEGERTIVDPT